MASIALVSCTSNVAQNAICEHLGLCSLDSPVVWEPLDLNLNGNLEDRGTLTSFKLPGFKLPALAVGL